MSFLWDFPSGCCSRILRICWHTTCTYIRTHGQIPTWTLSYSSEGSPALAVFRPHYLQIVFSWLHLDFLTTVFLYLVVTLAFKKNPMSSIGLEIRPQRAFSSFRVLLPSANYSAQWSGRVWQPSADSNDLLAHHYCQQRAVTPSLNSNKKGAKLPLLSAEGCHTRLDGQYCHFNTYQGVFFKDGETLWWDFVFD